MSKWVKDYSGWRDIFSREFWSDVRRGEYTLSHEVKYWKAVIWLRLLIWGIRKDDKAWKNYVKRNLL